MSPQKTKTLHSTSYHVFQKLAHSAKASFLFHAPNPSHAQDKKPVPIGNQRQRNSSESRQGKSELTRGAVAKSSTSRCKGPLKIAATDGKDTTSGCTIQTSDAENQRAWGWQKGYAKLEKRGGGSPSEEATILSKNGVRMDAHHITGDMGGTRPSLGEKFLLPQTHKKTVLLGYAKHPK